MAIHPNSIPSIPQPEQARQLASSDPHDIEVWTQQATEHLRALHLSATMYPPPVSSSLQGTSIPLRIPLDDPTYASPTIRDSRAQVPGAKFEDKGKTVGEGDIDEQALPRTGHLRRRSSLQRDSLRRREALLKGKEGSRRRQRWENDRLLNVPNAQPPLPTDWEVRPTHPVRSVPYFLAPLWDQRAAKRPSASNSRSAGARNQGRGAAEGFSKEAARVQKELRAKMKKAKGAKNLLMDLEETVRAFIQKWEEKEAELERSGAFEQEEEKSDTGSLDECAVNSDSSDGEDIVFVGRDLAMRDLKAQKEPRQGRKKMEMEELRRGKLVYDGLLDDHGAAFGYVSKAALYPDTDIGSNAYRRWLVHSIGTYYGLKTWSVTIGDPARREAYVGIADQTSRHRGQSSPGVQLPKPLWVTI
ncbi:MAG: hypothetical protein M1821_007927 [Bathelium mastoideum]|nr:MAG: hypothetical protein M1821_007927 [Bathelium mastoideum]KAI9692975.1 MAG: hypothetical protein M1822_004970 [Bathelium mastoideum]